MPLTSDITLNAGQFDPAAASEQSKRLNDHLIEILEKGPKWYEVRLQSLPCYPEASIAHVGEMPGRSCKVSRNAIEGRDSIPCPESPT